MSFKSKFETHAHTHSFEHLSIRKSFHCKSNFAITTNGSRRKKYILWKTGETGRHYLDGVQLHWSTQWLVLVYVFLSQCVTQSVHYRYKEWVILGACCSAVPSPASSPLHNESAQMVDKHYRWERGHVRRKGHKPDRKTNTDTIALLQVPTEIIYIFHHYAITATFIYSLAFSLHLKVIMVKCRQ